MPELEGSALLAGMAHTVGERIPVTLARTCSSGSSCTAAVRREIAPLLASLYGLSACEPEVVAAVARGALVAKLFVDGYAPAMGAPEAAPALTA